MTNLEQHSDLTLPMGAMGYAERAVKRERAPILAATPAISAITNGLCAEVSQKLGDLDPRIALRAYHEPTAQKLEGQDLSAKVTPHVPEKGLSQANHPTFHA